MLGKQKLENLSVEELEKVLLIKRRQVRLDRFQRLSSRGQPANAALVGGALEPAGLRQTAGPANPAVRDPYHRSRPTNTETKPPEQSRAKRVMNMVLLGLEVTAVAGLVTVLVASYLNLRELNDEVAVAQQTVLTQEAAPTSASTLPMAVGRLPGGHTPPTSPGGAVPDVPIHLQQWVQPAQASAAAAAAIEIEQQDVPAPTRIVIPKINVDAPIVAGVGWEDLKKGVGHLPGSAHPGERGNLYLAAHNDIYGEIFRYLDDLEPGDDYFVYGGGRKFRYVVKEKRIIEPTEVDVMLPTTEPVATLQTCYPYLIDSHRLVVVSELAD